MFNWMFALKPGTVIRHWVHNASVLQNFAKFLLFCSAESEIGRDFFEELLPYVLYMTWTQISAHVLQAPCATFVCNCTRISAQEIPHPSVTQILCLYDSCVTKHYQHQSKRLSICTIQLTVVICAFCVNELLYEREEETMSALKNPDKVEPG